MGETTVTLEELLVSSLAQTDALAKVLIEKGIITQQEFLAKILEERATYQAMLKPTPNKLHQCTALRVENRANSWNGGWIFSL
jgi:hypothetical protein